MIEPKEIDIEGKTFIISKFPAIAGREIVTQYVASGIPKLGDYTRNEELMLKLMCYVAVPIPNSPGNDIKLTTRTLVDNHVGDWEILGKIEMAMMEYNCRFFRDGRASTLLNGIAQKAQAWVTKMSMGLSGQSSPTEKQP